jgi:hypothetical protein
MATKSPLQKILKRILHREDENKYNYESMKPLEKNRQEIRVALN